MTSSLTASATVSGRRRRNRKSCLHFAEVKSWALTAFVSLLPEAEDEDFPSPKSLLLKFLFLPLFLVTEISDIPSGSSSARNVMEVPVLHLHTHYYRGNMLFFSMYFDSPSLWICLFMQDIHFGNSLFPFVCFPRSFLPVYNIVPFWAL